MDPIILIIIAVFLLALAVGALSLVYYNRFAEKQGRIQEALENITLFLGQRQSGLESLQPLLDHLNQTIKQDLGRALEIGRSSQMPDDMPGRAEQLTEADRLTGRIVANLRAGAADLSAEQVLDRLERAETELNGARRYHNALVREYNTMVKGFPSALVALLFRIQEKAYLSTTQE